MLFGKRRLNMAQLHAAFLIAVTGLEDFFEQAVGGGDDGSGILRIGIELRAGRALILRLMRLMRVESGC